MNALPAYRPSGLTTDVDVPALVQSFDPRTVSASVLLSEPSRQGGLGTGFDFIEGMALLPVDPEADARFATFSKTLVKAVPRRVIRRK